MKLTSFTSSQFHTYSSVCMPFDAFVLFYKYNLSHLSHIKSVIDSFKIYSLFILLAGSFYGRSLAWIGPPPSCLVSSETLPTPFLPPPTHRPPPTFNNRQLFSGNPFSWPLCNSYSEQVISQSSWDPSITHQRWANIVLKGPNTDTKMFQEVFVDLKKNKYMSRYIQHHMLERSHVRWTC